MTTPPKSKLWQRLSLRGRLLAIMLTATLTATLLCTLVFGLTFGRTMNISQDLQQNLADNVHYMLEMLVYQQDAHIKEVYTHQQSVFLDERLADLAQQGESPDWDELLLEAYTLINGAVRDVGGHRLLDSENATGFLYINGELYLHAAFQVEGDRFLAEIDTFCSEQELADDFFTALSEYDNSTSYSPTENGMILVWSSFGAEDGRIGLTVPLRASGVADILRGLMEEESALAAAESTKVVLRAAIVLLAFVVLLVVLLILLSRKLSNIYVTPVEDELSRAAEEKELAQRMARLKDEFLGNVSHELKTPLTAIRGYAQESGSSLADLSETEDARHAMTVIASETDRLALMVSQLLDVTRIEEGRMTLDLHPVFLPEILQSTLQTYYPAFTKNNNALELLRGSDSPTVLCDRARVTQVLVNLISNAAQHTHDGKITIGVRARDGFAEISVCDTGEGIPSELLPALFERYKTSGKKARDGRETGTGLGLYICKHIITAHGGEITIESEPGTGTTARFTLALQS